MKKKHIILITYSVYVLLLFAVASYYQYLDELPESGEFFSGFSRSLGYARDFSLLALFSTWLFLTIVHFVYRKLFVAFVFVAPLLHLLVSLLVYLAADFILWIAQLRLSLSSFQEGFLITSISSTVLMIWFFGDVFKSKETNNISSIT